MYCEVRVGGRGCTVSKGCDGVEVHSHCTVKVCVCVCDVCVCVCVCGVCVCVWCVCVCSWRVQGEG